MEQAVEDQTSCKPTFRCFELKDADEKALDKANRVAGAMLQFRDALAKAESERILLRSQL